MLTRMDKPKRYRLGILATHPIQYDVPWYRALAQHAEIDLMVFYGDQASPADQAKAGFGVPFEWDIPLLEGYRHRFLKNRAVVPNVSTFFGCNTPEIGQIIHAEHFDAFLVRGWSTVSSWQAITACWRSRTPILVRGDSCLIADRWIIKRWLRRPLHRWFVPRFDAYLVVGQRAREYYLYYGADPKKMLDAPHAVDNEFFATRRAALEPERGRLRQRWGIPTDAVAFLFSGKLVPKKRPGDFLRAIVQSRRKAPHLFGLIVGDGPLRPSLEKFAATHRLPVTFTGFLNQTRMPEAYTAADALVLPSSYGETWGLVVNEAMASGLPAFVSDRVGCALDLVVPGKTGEVFRCGDVKGFAALCEQAARDPQQLRPLGQAARQRIEQYSIARAVEGTLAAIRSVARIILRRAAQRA